MGDISASPSCRPMRSAASMRRLVTSRGRCTDPCVLQKWPPCASTTTRSPAHQRVIASAHYARHLLQLIRFLCSTCPGIYMLRGCYTRPWHAMDASQRRATVRISSGLKRKAKDRCVEVSTYVH